jgi:hypothetical protein
MQKIRNSTMWRCLVGLSLGVLAGCSSLPPHDPAQAWIDVAAFADNQLQATQVDGQPWAAGEYFQVAPGSHSLGLNFQYWTDAGYGREPLAQTCDFQLSYAGFRADHEYQLVAGWGPTPEGAWLRLLNERGDQLAYDTCGDF